MSHLLRSNNVQPFDVDDPTQMLMVVGIAVVILSVFLCLLTHCIVKTIPRAILVDRLPIGCHVYSLEGTPII